jgi:hypothetical protein
LPLPSLPLSLSSASLSCRKERADIPRQLLETNTVGGPVAIKLE